MICSYYKSSRHRCENNIATGTINRYKLFTEYLFD
jgi:hypothetical protein